MRIVRSGAGKTIVTSKWWDAKGPRTIELGPKGQAELTGGFMLLFVGFVIAAIVALFLEPLLQLQRMRAPGARTRVR